MRASPLVGLPTADLVALAVAGRRPRVDGVDPVACTKERRDPRTTVGLDANYDLGQLRRVLSEQLMQGGHALQALGQPPRCEALALLVHEVDIVMVFRPVVAHEHWHPRAPSTDRPAGCDPLGLLRDGLMDQCSSARHPISAWHAQTNQPGHGLSPEIAMPQGLAVLPGWWSGPSLPEPLGDRYDPMRTRCRSR